MKLIRFDTAERYEPEPDWQRASLCGERDVSVEYFVKPPHHATPMHDHPSAQVLVVLQGRIAVTTEAAGAQELGPMDAAYIPGNEPHIVTNVLDTPSVGVDIFVPGRSFDFWLKRLRQPGSADEGHGILGSSS